MMENNSKTIRLILFPFLIYSLAIYTCLYLVKPLSLAYQISLAIGSIFFAIICYLEKVNILKSLKLLFSWKRLYLYVPILFIVIVFGFVLSPLVKSTIVDGQALLGLSSLGDFYKHLYVLSTVKSGGLPPQHPFFPESSLSYYYGYYLIPAAISSVLKMDLAQVFFLYLLFTVTVILLTVVLLITSLFKTWYQQLLTLTLFLFGTGLDIIPTLIQAKSGVLTANHIEFWAQTLSLSNYLVNNLYTALLWVPQHSLPAIIVLATAIFYLKDKKVPYSWIVLSIWFCFITSTFVSVALVIWFGLLFLFLPKLRLQIFFASLLSFVLLFPYLSGLLDRASVLTFGFHMTPFKYLQQTPYWIDALLTVITEYGFILISIPLFIFIRQKKQKNLIYLISLAITLPILLGLFIKSSGFNDYSMRSVLPSQMAMPFLMSYVLVDINSVVWKKVVFFLVLLSFIPSMTGFFYEVHFKLLDRGVINAQNSKLLIGLRNTPVTNLATISNEDWVFLIPSYGYNPIYSPRLFDSIGYLSKQGEVNQKLYADQVNSLFLNQTHADTPEAVILKRQKDFSYLTNFFQSHQNKNFIISKHKGDKGGINPWYQIISANITAPKEISPGFFIYSGSDLVNSFSASKTDIKQNQIQRLTPNRNQQIFLNQGLWAIVLCNQNATNGLRLEFQESFVAFDTTKDPSPSKCTGDIYYQSVAGNLKLSPSSKFEYLYISPIKVSPNSP